MATISKKTTNARIDYLLAEYNIVRTATEAICRPLQKEDYVVQPKEEVSPPKWHLGHTSWFFESFILKEHVVDYKVFDPDFNYVFNSYYEAAGTRVMRTDRGNLSRPGVEQIYEYRQYVDDAMRSWIASGECNEAQLEILVLGLNHEQQHQELLISDIKYILGNNPLMPAYKMATCHNPLDAPSPKNLEYLPVQEGIYKLGHEKVDSFCYDNEQGAHRVFLESYAIANRLITNAEYLEFIEAGAYTDFRFWLSEGWELVKSQGWKAPEYWHKIDGIWYSYTMYGLQKLKLNEPVVHVSYFEADAFANWKGQRLATEAEWEVACKKFEHSIPASANFQESQVFHPQVAVTDGLQLYGDCWEWTGSAYLPYPNFKKAPGALGEYNGKFMINQMVLRGGSCATPKNHIRCTYRNFFQPHLRWQFTGIRLAKHL